VLLGTTRRYSTPLDITWRYLALLGATWRYLALLGATWRYLALLGATWRYLALLGASWRYLNLALLDAARRCSMLLDTDKPFEICQKWIEEHKQEYRGNRTGDLTDAYMAKVAEGVPHFTGTLRYSLRYSTLLYATLRYSTLLYATLRYSTLLYATLRYMYYTRYSILQRLDLERCYVKCLSLEPNPNL
jgi:uncharacterized protein YjbI with pentapeptide repeats